MGIIDALKKGKERFEEWDNDRKNNEYLSLEKKERRLNAELKLKTLRERVAKKQRRLNPPIKAPKMSGLDFGFGPPPRRGRNPFF